MVVVALGGTVMVARSTSLVALSVAKMATDGDQLGGSSFYEAYPIHLGGGFFAGASKELSVSDDGDLTTTGNLSATGGTLDFGSTGTTTIDFGNPQWNVVATTGVKWCLKLKLDGLAGSTATTTPFSMTMGACS